MKREFAATIFSILLTGTAFAGPVEQSELPPPAQSQDSAELRGLIDKTLSETSQSAPEAGSSPAPVTWTTPFSAELWLEGVPGTEGVPLDVLAKNQKRYPGYRTIEEQEKKLPTAYKWDSGNWRANISTSVAANTATSNPAVLPELDPNAFSPSGGTGYIDGRVVYGMNAWEFYGGTRRNVAANPDGTVALSSNFLGGTYYKLPPSLVDGKIGTGFEVNPLGDAKTRIEYRHVFGTQTEGFLSAERSSPFQPATPEPVGNHGLTAGINRKL